jgi:hypothetical protein
VGKVFISYSHDSPEHSERVLALSNQLRALGVDTELDRYHVRPPQGWPHWCEEQLRPESSRFVLVICTPTYRGRVENRVGEDEGRGVYWEGAILYTYLYNAKGNSRFIPVLLDDVPEEAIPLPLDGHTRYRIRAFEHADPDFEALYRELTGQPETPKPALGDVINLDAGRPPVVAKSLPEKKAVTDFPSGGSFWSPFSNEDSVERGEVRFWAIVETVAAIAVFWWVAIRYETFLPLTTSLFVAPLLLLRSEESTLLGVKWIDEGMFPPRWPEEITAIVQNRWLVRWMAIGTAIGLAAGLGLGYPGAKLYLVGHEGWSAFWRGMGLGLALSWFADAVEPALARAGGLELHTYERRERDAAKRRKRIPVVVTVKAAMQAGPVLGAGLGLVAVAIAGAGAGAAAATVAGYGVRWVALRGMIGGKGAARAAAGVVAVLFVVLPVPIRLLGIWLYTVIVRFAATARHAREGYRRLPTNLRRLALCMTPLQQPELLPGLSADHSLRFNVYFRHIFSDFDGLEPLRGFTPPAVQVWVNRSTSAARIFWAPLIYTPAWAYRFVLKSTLWFWWILFIVGGAPRLDGGVEGLRADAYRKASAWVSIATTVFAVVGFGFGWLLKPEAENLPAEAKLPTAIALLVLVDWKSIPVVQWITLFSALTTIAVVIWTRDVYVDSWNPQRATRVAAQLPWLGHLVKWKAGFGAIGIALLMLYFVLYANATRNYVPVSDWAEGWLRWLYGAAAERLRPVVA